MIINSDSVKQLQGRSSIPITILISSVLLLASIVYDPLLQSQGSVLSVGAYFKALGLIYAPVLLLFLGAKDKWAFILYNTKSQKIFGFISVAILAYPSVFFLGVVATGKILVFYFILWALTLVFAWLSPICLPMALSMQIYLYSLLSSPLWFSFTDKLLCFYAGLAIFSGHILSRTLISLKTRSPRWLFSTIEHDKEIVDDVLTRSLFIAVAASYFASGIEKLMIGWIYRNDISQLYLSSVFQLRFSFFGGLYKSIASGLQFLSVPSQAVAVVIELLPAFLITNPYAILASLSLILVVVLHISIFITSGIFFWKWIIIDLLLAYTLLKKRNSINQMN